MHIKAHNPHMNMMFLGLMMLFYHYYDFSLAVSHYTNHYRHNQNILIFVFTLAPFTFSSLFSPLGGIIIANWQKHSRNYIFPYLFLIDSVLCVVSNWTIHNLYLPQILYLAMLSRVIQGMLLGGMLPQYVLFFYAESANLMQRVNYGNLFFILFYLAVIAAIINVNYFNSSGFDRFNWFFTGLYFLTAIIIFKYKSLWHNFHIENITINHSWSLKKTWHLNRGSIIRFTMFLTFMASVNAFFLTVMPYFLSRYLNYPAELLYNMQILIILCGILGFLCGGYFHRKIGRKFHLSMGVVIKILLFILFKFYVSHSIAIVATIGSLCLFICGLMASKILLILNSIFTIKSRLFGIALTYNLSWGLMFGMSGYITMHLIENFHNLYIPSLFITFFSYVSLISLWYTPDKDFFRYLKKAG